jgi:hypothetical protein
MQTNFVIQKMLRVNEHSEKVMEEKVTERDEINTEVEAISNVITDNMIKEKTAQNKNNQFL